MVTDAKIIIALAAALAASVLGHIGSGYVYLQQRDALTAARTDLVHAEGAAHAARTDAAACSQSVEALSTSAAVLATQLDAERRAASDRASTHYARADKILSTPAAVPGDACASAQTLVREILTTREKGGS